MDTALVLSGHGYQSPAVAFGAVGGEEEHAIWWAVAVGFAYAVALAWASWCRHTGGDPDIQFGWTGFKVVCRSN